MTLCEKCLHAEVCAIRDGHEECDEIALKYCFDFRGWISVEDRLPEVSGDYLTFHEHGTRCVLYYNADIKLWNVYYSDDVHCAIRSITHWMPLPEAPKMKGGAEE